MHCQAANVSLEFDALYLREIRRQGQSRLRRLSRTFHYIHINTEFLLQAVLKNEDLKRRCVHPWIDEERPKLDEKI